jgi:hypothetical protein
MTEAMTKRIAQHPTGSGADWCKNVMAACRWALQNLWALGGCPSESFPKTLVSLPLLCCGSPSPTLETYHDQDILEVWKLVFL